MNVNLTTNSYNSLGEFLATNRLILPDKDSQWRLVKNQPFGSIKGLPTMQGIAVATNGILVAIERSDRSILFGHLEWFRGDKGEIIIEKNGEPKAIGSKTSEKESSFSMSLLDFGKSGGVLK